MTLAPLAAEPTRHCRRNERGATCRRGQITGGARTAARTNHLAVAAVAQPLYAAEACPPTRADAESKIQLNAFSWLNSVRTRCVYRGQRLCAGCRRGHRR